MADMTVRERAMDRAMGLGPIRIAIVFHSGYGHTARQAEAVAEGVRLIDGADAVLLPVEEVERSWAVLEAAPAIIFGAPTYVAGPSAAFKAFQESSSNAMMAKGYL